MVSQIDCLDKRECKQIQERVHSLKMRWERRIGDLPFFTLGAASYLDTTKKGEFFYKMKAKRLNFLLKEQFSDLYGKVKAVLEEELENPVCYEEQFAHPGFHIFLYTEVFQYAIASVHFDLQFQRLSWRYKQVNKEQTLSFTLPIVLPKNGGGLFCWDIQYDDVKDLSDSEITTRSEDQEPVHIEYEIGKLVIHKGLFLHQIAPAEEMQPEDERITLQGHGLFCDGAWRLYW